MTHYYWNDWYLGWGWFLWLGMIFLIFANIGNWGYTYRAHRRFEDVYSRRNALAILNERYARGEIKHEEYLQIKSHILSDNVQAQEKDRKAGTVKNRTQANSSQLPAGI